MMRTAQGLVDFARSKIGTNYFFGAKGTILTRKSFEDLRRKYPTPKTYGWESSKIGTVCCDCSGLISWYTGIVRGSWQYKDSAVDTVSISAILDNWNSYIGYGLWLRGHVGIVSDRRGYYIAEDGSSAGCVERRMSYQKWVHGLKLRDIDYKQRTVAKKYYVSKDSASYYNRADKSGSATGVAYRGQAFSGATRNNAFTKSDTGVGAGKWFENSSIAEGIYTGWNGKGTKYEGVNRYETASKIVKATYAQADQVIVVTGENFPDALSVMGYAGYADAPVIISSRTMPRVISSTIEGLGAKEIIAVGGTVGCSFPCVRLSGENRYVTAELVNQYAKGKGWNPDTVIVATGDSYPDGMAISGYSYRKGYPIVFCSAGTLAEESRNIISQGNFSNAVIIGGVGVVTTDTENWLKANVGVTTRVGGASRYETAVQVAERFASNWSKVVIASGENFPDGIEGGVLAGKNAYPLILTPANTTPECVLDCLRNHKGTIRDICWLGGLGAVGVGVRQKYVGASGI